MCRKRIVQLLTSFVVLSCMVLPVQAAPQVNIVPLIQLLLLSPTEVEKVDSGMWDGVNAVPKTDFLTTDEKACFFGSYSIEPNINFNGKLEWFYGDNFYYESFNVDLSGVVNWDFNFCILMAGDPPLDPPPLSTEWKAKVSIDGMNIDEGIFTIQDPP